MGDRAQPTGMIDWTAMNLAASIALAMIFLHVSEEILRFALPTPVFAGVGLLTLFIAEKTLDYGLPFAGAFLLIRCLDLSAPLRAAPVVAWILFLCSLVLHIDRLYEILAIQVLIPYGAGRFLVQPYFGADPIPIRLATAVGVLGAWLWVAGGFVVALVRRRVALRMPTHPEVAVALLAGVALPAAALAPFLPVAIEYNELYPAQEVRFHELCKSTKVELFRPASAPKSIFFDPNEDVSCWDARDGQCWPDHSDQLAQYLVINWRLELVEFWENTGQKKPRELKRCFAGGNCQTVATITARYRVTTREIQSKADEALRLRIRTVTVDERETGTVLGRLQFVYSDETHRICAPGAKPNTHFGADGFIVKALALEERFRR